jgi:hypothetical protein
VVDLLNTGQPEAFDWPLSPDAAGTLCCRGALLCTSLPLGRSSAIRSARSRAIFSSLSIISRSHWHHSLTAHAQRCTVRRSHREQHWIFGIGDLHFPWRPASKHYGVAGSEIDLVHTSTSVCLKTVSVTFMIHNTPAHYPQCVSCLIFNCTKRRHL